MPSNPRASASSHALRPFLERRRAVKIMLWFRTDRSSRRRRTFRGSPRRSRPSSSTRNEGHANREGCWLLRGLPPQPLEPRDERAIVHHHLPVEDERPGLEPADRFDELGESRGEVAAIPADQAHGTRGLERHHPPAVYLLLVDPPGAIGGARDERGVHEGEERRGHSAQCNWLVCAGPPSASTD